MQSANVVTGTDILAAAYNNLRTDVIANLSGVADATTAASAAGVDATAAIAAASGAAADVVTHAAVTANIHGLGSGIDVMGSQAAGYYIQHIYTHATVSHTDGGNSETTYISAEWTQAFNWIGAAVVSCGAAHDWEGGSGYLENIRHISFNTTAVTVAVRTYQSAAVKGQIPLNALGIGN